MAKSKNIDIWSRFKKNIIQTIIGLILLFFVFNYLQNKDSEKRAFFGWFEIIGQKAYLTYLTFVDPTRAKILSTQYDIEKSFKEMELMLQSCNPKSELNKTLEDIKNSTQAMSVETFSQNVSSISEKRSSLYEAITLECQKQQS